MFVILPVEATWSEDPATMAPLEVRRVTVQLLLSEADALRAGEPVTEADLVSIIRSALIDADGPA